MSENLLENTQLQLLRNEGTISENEIVIIEADILVAKNVVSLERRIIGKVDEILKENKTRRILKG